MGVVVATAYMDEAAEFDWLVAMDDGRVLATGTPAELREQTGTSSLDEAFIALLPEEKRSQHRKVEIPPRVESDGEEPAIEAEGLTIRFGNFTAVDNVSFRIPRGEIFGFLGSNGCGKTTSIAKLAKLFSDSGKKVVLGAADTFRAAAVEQLTVWAERLGAEIVTGSQGTDPASVAHRAVARALEISADVCIVDTAGRLQTQQNLMQELTKIFRVIGKQIPDAPHEVILVLDATTGQNGISQAQHFTEAVRCSGIVLAKLDGTAKGGIVVAIRQSVGLPVKYIGVGEQADDLALYEPNPVVDALFEEVGG